MLEIENAITVVCRSAIPSIRESDPRLVAALLAIAAAHEPEAAYAPCGHEHTHDELLAETVLDVPGAGLICEAGIVGVYCAECCGEWCNAHDNGDPFTDHYPCHTARAAIAAISGVRVEFNGGKQA